MAITQIDLKNLEIKLKGELSEDFKKRHHELAGKVQDDYNKIDKKVTEYNTDIRLYNLSFTTMSENFQEMKELMKESFDKMNIKIDGLDTRYSGKWAEKVLVGLGATIGISLIGALMALLLNKY